MRHWLLRSAAVVAMVTGALASSAHGSMGGYFEGVGSGMIEGKLVSASVMFSVTGADNQLHIRLTNTGTRTDYAMAHVLSDISFNLEGADFDFEVGPESDSSVVVGSDSTLYYMNKNQQTEPVGFDVSSEWGLARNTTMLPSDGFTEPVGPFDYSITATSFDGNEEMFANGTLDFDSPTLNGSDFGLINFETGPTDPPFKNHEIILNSVNIVLCATRVLTIGDLHFIKSPTFSYGSHHTGIVGIPDDIIPEPSAVIVWSLLGLTWAGSSWVRRRRRGRIHGRTEKALA